MRKTIALNSSDNFINPNMGYNVFKEIIFRNILSIFVAAVLFSSVGLTYYCLSSDTYRSELRFIVKSEGSSYGVLNGVLGGLGSMLGAGSIGTSLERTIQIAGSDRILGAVLLSKVEFNGNKDILANVFIKVNNLHKVWRKEKLLNQVEFNQTDSVVEKMALQKRRALKLMEEMIMPERGGGILSKSFEKKSGVVTLTAVHENEQFAILITKTIFSVLRDFYVEQATNAASTNVFVLQKKLDSIKTELSRVQTSYAKNTDQSYGLLFQVDKVELKKLAVREQVLLAMYAEAQKNLETFKFMNDSAIPSLTVIDMPYSPLKKNEKSILIYTLGAGVLGALLLFLLLYVLYLVKIYFSE